MAVKKKTTEDVEDVEDVEKTDVEDTQPKAKKGAVTKVIFHVRNHNHSAGYAVREFTEAEQGEEFISLADQFAETNASHILSRKDE